MQQRLFHLHALSALHVGTGQSAGTVDLPIARARATHLPLVPGSAIKGVLRDDLPQLNDAQRKTLFGPASISDEGVAHAGALAVGDAHLLILPVRSLTGIVAFATCPFILHRYARDIANAPALPKLADGECAVTGDTELISADKVVLEDLDLNVLRNSADAWAAQIATALYPGKDDWQKSFRQHFAILPDNVFSFLADTATEIRARIKINDETRVVADGALWYEENLPAESVLWGVIGISPARDGSKASPEALSAQLPAGETALQIGGKHTVGRGLCRFLLA